MRVPGKGRRGRRPLPPEQQRRRLLEAAERSFERNRYEGAGIQSIVREAGMSSRSFYQFFDEYNPRPVFPVHTFAGSNTWVLGAILQIDPLQQFSDLLIKAAVESLSH